MCIEPGMFSLIQQMRDIWVWTLNWWLTGPIQPLARLSFLWAAFYFKFIFRWTTFKAFIEYVTLLLPFYVLVFWWWGMWTPGLKPAPTMLEVSILTTGPPGSPQPLISGVVSFFVFWLCWAFTAAHGFSPVGLKGSYSALAELGLSGRRLLLWSAGPRAPPA